MSYNVTGTNGNDTLNRADDIGPGTIVGLAGDDFIETGVGFASVDGGPGNDAIVLSNGNTGLVDGGDGNDYIFNDGVLNAIVLLGGAGADTFQIVDANVGLTIRGGNDSSDGADSILAGSMSDLVFGNGGNDTINEVGGNDTLIGGFGDDSVWTPGGAQADLVFANEGNDTTVVGRGNDTVFGGLGDDSLIGIHNVDLPLYFGNEGADTIAITGALVVTIIGGNDSADGNDSLTSAGGSDFIFGNGGADTIAAGAGANTVVAGFGVDSVLTGAGADLIFANESNDVVEAGDGANTVFGGLGNDVIGAGAGADSILGNENNDTIRGRLGADTIAGGSGNDLFVYQTSADDGSASSGAVDRITDLNWAEDRIQLFRSIAFAANVGAQPGADLSAAADRAILAAFELNNKAPVNVAAQFTFDGHTYLAINTDTAFNAFADAGDLLIDITGVTGTITASSFVAALIGI